jgi:hypothetical protein
MEFAFAALVIAAALGLVIFVNAGSLPPAEAISATVDLDQRKAQIYEGLRDLQFEYRLGKLSDDDYQKAKTNLQRELATVLAEIDQVLGGKTPLSGKLKASVAKPGKAAKPAVFVCPECGSNFAQPMKFCGNCAAPMSGGVSA